MYLTECEQNIYLCIYFSIWSSQTKINTKILYIYIKMHWTEETPSTKKSLVWEQLRLFLRLSHWESGDSIVKHLVDKRYMISCDVLQGLWTEAASPFCSTFTFPLTLTDWSCDYELFLFRQKIVLVKVELEKWLKLVIEEALLCFSSILPWKDVTHQSSHHEGLWECKYFATTWILGSNI